MPMEARPRPVLWAHYVPVPNRIEVDVIAMPEVILLVSDSVLPVARLPNPAPPLAAALLGYIPIAPAVGKIFTGEKRLDLPPACGKIIIAVRQRPDAMKVVRQEDEGEEVKRKSAADGGERTSKDSPRQCRRSGCAASDTSRP